MKESIKSILESLEKDTLKEFSHFGGAKYLDQYKDNVYRTYKYGKPAEAAVQLEQAIDEITDKVRNALNLAGSFQAPGLYIAFYRDLKNSLEKAHKLK